MQLQSSSRERLLLRSDARLIFPMTSMLKRMVLPLSVLVKCSFSFIGPLPTMRDKLRNKLCNSRRKEQKIKAVLPSEPFGAWATPFTPPRLLSFWLSLILSLSDLSLYFFQKTLARWMNWFLLLTTAGTNPKAQRKVTTGNVKRRSLMPQKFTCSISLFSFIVYNFCTVWSTVEE